ncbi:hypothetical protein BS636_15160 [Acinetobacter sp. LoGeW2-3]|uniref:acylphosphatase n=1 Tax=Acinetobacter sp. LoGeW2-3 TaxID=1808001 RepID=UPI000C05A61E|nr:acylphosphatase [Acinetobacter sp. LoGeW2-3]ATO20919.1 hypothetical protein BS636_15160 [Acinetobacter sp. LoGeW2-3]
MQASSSGNYIAKEALKNSFVQQSHSKEEAWEKVKEFNNSIVVKPLNSYGGEGVTTNIVEKVDFDKAWNLCEKLKHKTVIVEEYVEGNDYRIVVIDNKLCSVTQRVPPFIIGDGQSTIEELIQVRQIERSKNIYLGEHPLKLDQKLINFLSKKNLTLNSIVNSNEKVELLDVVNISSGGGSIDHTDNIHPDWLDIAIRAKEALLSPIMLGLDFMAEDIQISPKNQKWTIIEVNANPALALPQFPKYGKGRDVASSLLDSLFPNFKPSIRTYSFTIYGIVQNVGYRSWLKTKCELYGIDGFVQNNQDKSSIDITIKGPKATLQHIIQICYDGPKDAQVEKICFNKNILNSNFNNFQIIE